MFANLVVELKNLEPEVILGAYVANLTLAVSLLAVATKKPVLLAAAQVLGMAGIVFMLFVYLR